MSEACLGTPVLRGDARRIRALIAASFSPMPYMPSRYAAARRAFPGGFFHLMKRTAPVAGALWLASVGPARAQALTIRSVTPAANDRAVARTGAVTVLFSDSLTAGSTAALKVFSAQRGGLRTGANPVVGSKDTLRYRPLAYPFRPGETVQVSVTRTAAAGAGTSPLLVRPRVFQFTAAVAGTGRGNFQATSALSMVATPAPNRVVVGDVDGDGDLDFLTANYTQPFVSVRLNNGAGVFSAPANTPEVSVGPFAADVALGDVDGDGDLDFVTANGDNTASVRLNNGRGVFAAPASGAEIATGTDPLSVALWDVDGDGDLDLLSANGGASSVSVRLNNGAGVFASLSAAPDAAVGYAPFKVVLGDVDNDGDLDLLTANQGNGGTVSVRLNNGAGAFSASATAPTVVLGGNPTHLALGDLDGDGDLDFVTTNTTSASTLNVRLNNGQGLFGGGGPVAVGPFNQAVVLGDVDSDGDLDLLAANASTTVSLRLNNGAGGFSAPASGAEIGGSSVPTDLALADLDGDGDLDFVSVNQAFAVVCLNLPRVLAATAGQPAPPFGLFPNPARTSVRLTGVGPGARVVVLDARGRVALTATADGTGTADLRLPERLAGGIYVVRAGGRARRLTVE